MKPRSLLHNLLCVGLLLPFQLQAREEPLFPPQEISVDQYERLARRSPFVLPSFEEEEVIADDGWADHLMIVSVLLLQDRQIIMVRDINSQERFPVKTEPNTRGIRLVSLTMHEDPREVEATIALDKEEAVIRYDTEILSSLPQANADQNPAIQP